MTNKENILDYHHLNKSLEEVVAKLQLEATSIEEALMLYEQAIDLIKNMEDYINKAENKIKIINKKGK